MHQDEGRYSAKHEGNSNPDGRIVAVLKAYIKDGRISCTDAHRAASEAGVSPAEAGRNLDLMETRISSCQLGLFGYKGRDKPGYAVPAEEEALLSAITPLSAEGGISCLNLWGAADEVGCTRMEAAAVCDKAGIKIADCQLGAF